MTIEHTPGKENEVADGLSRLPDTATTEKEPDDQTEKGPTFLFAENQEKEEMKENQKIKENRCETKNVKTQEGEAERSEVYEDKSQTTPYKTDEALETTFERSHNAMVGHKEHSFLAHRFCKPPAFIHVEGKPVKGSIIGALIKKAR